MRPKYLRKAPKYLRRLGVSMRLVFLPLVVLCVSAHAQTSTEDVDRAVNAAGAAIEMEAARDDAATITPRVKTALVNNAALRGTILNVDTTDSTVTISGSVQTSAQKALAAAIARKNAAGYKIINRLRVVGRARTADDLVGLVPSVKIALGNEPALSGARIDVEDAIIRKRRTLSLRGTVRTQAQKRLAEDVARREVPGFFIVNRLRVSVRDEGAPRVSPVPQPYASGNRRGKR